MASICLSPSFACQTSIKAPSAACWPHEKQKVSRGAGRDRKGSRAGQEIMGSQRENNFHATAADDVLDLNRKDDPARVHQKEEEN